MSSPSGRPRSQSSTMFSRSASRTMRSRLRRNCGSSRGQQHQPGQHPGPELLDHLAGRRTRCRPPSAATPARGTPRGRGPRAARSLDWGWSWTSERPTGPAADRSCARLPSCGGRRVCDSPTREPTSMVFDARRRPHAGRPASGGARSVIGRLIVLAVDLLHDVAGLQPGVGGGRAAAHVGDDHGARVDVDAELVASSAWSSSLDVDAADTPRKAWAVTSPSLPFFSSSMSGLIASIAMAKPMFWASGDDRPC